MATIVVDELITKLEYDANDAVLAQAEAAGKALEQQNKALVASTDKLSAESTKLAEHTDTLTKSQIDLSEQIAESSAKTDRLKAEQAALKETIEQAGGATGKQFRQLQELDEELAKSQRHTKELREENNRLGLEKRKVSVESRKLAREQKDVAETSRRAAADQRRLADAMRSAGGAAKSEAGAFGGLTSMIGGIAGGQLAADAVRAIAGAVIDLGKAVITTGANFESLRARLKTVEGSGEGAAMAFSMIQDFAKKTPFEVENITEAFTQLRVRGVNPTTDKLTALGDLSSAFGLQFKDTTDAIGAAARGELDPIEKLGITAKIAGDKISLSFKGQTEVVNRSASAVTDALVKFGQMSGVQGAMAEQSTTAAGMFSNLKDAVSSFFDQVAQMGVLDEVKLLLQSLGDVVGGENGLAKLLADVLVIGLRTVRELFEGIAEGGGGGVVEFFQAFVTILGQLASVLVDTIGQQTGFMALLYEIGTPILEAVSAIFAIGNSLRELGERFNFLPGPIDMVIGLVKFLIIPLEILANILQRVADWLTPLLDGFDGLGSRLPSISGLFTDLMNGVRGLGAEVGLLNEDLTKTAFIADQAVAALDKLRAKNDITKKTDAELQELRRNGGDPRAEAEIARRIAQREGAESQEATATRRAAEAGKSGQRLDKLLEKPEKLSRNQLDAMVGDPNITEKQRDKAQKEIDKRAGKAGKAGQKAAKQTRDSLLSATIAKDIEKLAQEAGAREAARALLGGASEEEANKRELAQRKAVNERLTQQYQTTHRLPPGISQDLVQVSNLPNIEQVGGRLAPPVITINNQRIEVTGNTFQANVAVEGTTATAGEIATAAVSQARAVLWEDLGRAIGNNTTTLRRG